MNSVEHTLSHASQEHTLFEQLRRNALLCPLFSDKIVVSIGLFPSNDKFLPCPYLVYVEGWGIEQRKGRREQRST